MSTREIVTRRDFVSRLPVIAGLAVVATGALLTEGCSSASAAKEPTKKPVPTLAPLQTSTPTVKPTETKVSTPLAEASKEITPIPQKAPVVGSQHRTSEAYARVDIGDDLQLTFFGKDLKNLSGFFSLQEAYRFQSNNVAVGPIAHVAFAFNRFDYIGTDLDAAEQKPFNSGVIEDTLRTTDGSNRDFTGKLTVIRHEAEKVVLREYVVEKETWNSETPIHPEFFAYVSTKNTWKVEMRGNERFAVPIGAAQWYLAQGNTKSGTIAYLFEKYPIKGVK